MQSNEIRVISFTHRLLSLQNLCKSGANDGSPSAILIIPGVDGRHNREAITFLKYLFGNIVGRELLDNSTSDDKLDEIVLLIKESSVSIIYGNEAKKIISPLLSLYPFVVEYIPNVENEVDVSHSIKFMFDIL